jgi:hypothetical protein
MANDQLVMICGEAVGGKSASLQNIDNPEGVIYLNCEAGKRLPFPSKFKQLTITDPHTVFAVFDEAEKPTNAHIHTIVIDSLTYLMDMYESVHVLTAKDTMKGWSEYQQFFKKMMQQYVAKSTKNVIFTAHTLATLNESEHVIERKVPIKGALKNVGLESYFSVVIAAKKMQISQLENYHNDMLTFTDDEKAIGLKYVFQTRLTKETVNERIRSPMSMWQINETYINNDVQILLDRLTEYYGIAVAA